MTAIGETTALPPGLARFFVAIESIREETLRVVRGVADDALFSAGSAGWSAGELLEHLLLAESSAGKVVRKVLRESGAAMPPYPADDSGLGIRKPITFDGMEAPAMVRPGEVASREALLAQAASTRAATRETLGMLAAVDPRAGFFPHPRFGSLDLYEWLAIVILEHEKCHRAQLLLAAGGDAP
jgi:hypothetical protein